MLTLRSLPIVASCLLAVMSGRAQASQKPMKVLLTSFEPFAGRTINNSMPIADELMKMSSQIGAGVELHHCNLRVVFDASSREALDCIDRVRPDLVISLGEAECALRLESAANNLDYSPVTPDNAGQTKPGRPIIPGGKQHLGLPFPVQALYCGLDSGSQEVEVSVNPGLFVCNNLAYHLGTELARRQTQFSFIHVPHSECAAAQKDPRRNAKTIAGMIKSAVAYLREEANASRVWPHSGNRNLMPASGETERLFQQLRSESAPACEMKYIAELNRVEKCPAGTVKSWDVSKKLFACLMDIGNGNGSSN